MCANWNEYGIYNLDLFIFIIKVDTNQIYYTSATCLICLSCLGDAGLGWTSAMTTLPPFSAVLWDTDCWVRRNSSSYVKIDMVNSQFGLICDIYMDTASRLSWGMGVPFNRDDKKIALHLGLSWGMGVPFNRDDKKNCITSTFLISECKDKDWYKVRCTCFICRVCRPISSLIWSIAIRNGSIELSLFYKPEYERKYDTSFIHTLAFSSWNHLWCNLLSRYTKIKFTTHIHTCRYFSASKFLVVKYRDLLL